MKNLTKSSDAKLRYLSTDNFFRMLKYIVYLISVITAVFLLSGCKQHMTGLLNAQGMIARDERKLLFDALALMLIVVVPVIIMSFAFAFRYRASHPTSEYRPDWSHNYFLETIWWGIPLVMIIVLGILTWKKTHQLDPYRTIPVPGPIEQVQVVSLRWKWLFIYPKEKIATVNYLQIPDKRQVEFFITSDAPMSAFFIPSLGSQIYAMAGMRTRLHLYTSHPGVYDGLDSQYNGAGFSNMHFKVKVTSQTDFNKWVNTMKTSKKILSISEYKRIVQPTLSSPVIKYSSVYPDLFNRIMMQYTKPGMRLH